MCDEQVNADMSVNDPHGPSVDSRTADRKAKVTERLAHRACNTRKGAVKVAIAWPDRLHVVEPAQLITVAERLERRGGRELVARCPSQKDARETADWLVDRFSLLRPRKATQVLRVKAPHPAAARLAAPVSTGPSRGRR